MVSTWTAAVIGLFLYALARDNGATLDLQTGQKDGERIVLNLPASLKTDAAAKQINVVG